MRARLEWLIKMEQKLSLDERIALKVREYIMHKSDNSPFPGFEDYAEFFRQELELTNHNIIESYPGIYKVAAFLYRAITACKSYSPPIQPGEAIPLFGKIGIKTLDEYVNMLDEGKLRVVWHYKDMWEVLKKFKDS